MRFYPLVAAGLVLFSQSGFAFVSDSSQRKEFYQVDPGNGIYRNAFDASVSLFTPDHLAPVMKPTFFHRPGRVNDLLGAPLCSDEDLANEPSASYCSGVLIAPQLVLTAGHCVSEDLCDQMRIAFDYRFRSWSKLEKITDHEVYRCSGFVGGTSKPQEVYGTVVDNADDYALILLDRPVPDHKPAELDPDFQGEKRAVFAVSAPFGTPEKLIDGGTVFGPGDLPRIEHDLLTRRDDSENFMATNLSQGPGSSGGPVFDAKTGKLLALTSQGPAQDFYDELDPDSDAHFCKKEIHYDSRSFDYRRADAEWAALGNEIENEEDPAKKEALITRLNALYANYTPLAPGYVFKVSAVPHLAEYVASADPARYLSFNMAAERAAERARMDLLLEIRKLYEAPLKNFPKSELVSLIQKGSVSALPGVDFVACYDVTGLYSPSAAKKTAKFSLMLSPDGDSEMFYPQKSALDPALRLGSQVLLGFGGRPHEPRVETALFKTDDQSFFVEDLVKSSILKYIERAIGAIFAHGEGNPIRMEKGAKWIPAHRLFCPADPEKWKGLAD